MQFIQEHAAELYEDMEKDMQLFKRESYQDNFVDYRERNREIFDEMTRLLRENEDAEGQSVLREIARAVVYAALEKKKASRSRINKESEQLNLNMITVVYVIPGIRAIKEKRAEELSEVLCEEWSQFFKGNHIKPSDFQSIQDGFKTKLCYVTTAVCRGLDKPDGCYELALLKKYRDEYLAEAEGGKELIHDYYDIAPTIVKRIDKSAEAEETYHYIWEHYIAPCVHLIEAGEQEACRRLYVEMVEELHRKYMEEYYG